MPIWTMAKKEARLLLRDPRAGFILLAMPFLFILVLGLSLGETFGQKPDERLRVTLVDLDKGFVDPISISREALVSLAWSPTVGPLPSAIPPSALSAATSIVAQRLTRFPQQSWAKEVQRDLSESNIRVQTLSLDQAKHLIKSGKRAAVLVFGPNFSRRVHESSFLAQGINPFYREGVNLSELDVEVLKDD